MNSNRRFSLNTNQNIIVEFTGERIVSAFLQQSYSQPRQSIPKCKKCLQTKCHILIVLLTIGYNSIGYWYTIINCCAGKTNYKTRRTSL